MSTPPLVLFTLGHSNRTVDEFLKLLRRSGIRQMADIRRYPGSRRHPHFERENLDHILNMSWVAYRHMEALGGHRAVEPGSPHTALENGLRGYAGHMETAEFAEAATDLTRWAGAARTAVLCAEADPLRCHRQLLADYLLVRGIRVVHIEDAETIRDHTLTRVARREGDRLIYDGGALELEF